MTQDNDQFDIAYSYFQQRWDQVNQTIAHLTNLSSIPRRMSYDAEWHKLAYGHDTTTSTTTTTTMSSVENLMMKESLEAKVKEEKEKKEVVFVDVGLAFSVLSVEPIYYNACESSKCVAVRTLDSACVCNL
jgi:hypothetical protein